MGSFLKGTKYPSRFQQKYAGYLASACRILIRQDPPPKNEIPGLLQCLNQFYLSILTLINSTVHLKNETRC